MLSNCTLKIVNFMLYIFFATIKKKGKGVMPRAEKATVVAK